MDSLRKGVEENYSDQETARRRDAALLRALRTPHKRQSEMKVGRKSSVASDPTELALRRVLDGRAASASAGVDPTDDLVCVILGCLPLDIYNATFLPADRTRGPHLAISFKPEFERYVAFAAEYWASLGHEQTSLSQTPNVSGT